MTNTAQYHEQLERPATAPALADAMCASDVWRVLIVEDADRLNESSGNVLLKGIEGMHALVRGLLRTRMDSPGATLAIVD